MQASYTKLKSGDWGIRAEGSLAQGDRVTVTKKSGETKTEVVGQVVWTGNGVTLCTIAHQDGQRGQGRNSGRVWDSQKFNGYSAPRGGYVKACVSGGNCSSIGSGRSCGGHDCDGY
jgi:hypothetical protein